MNRKQYLIQKISNLIISIEILDIYSKKYSNKIRNQYICINYFFLPASKIILNYNLKMNLIYILFHIYIVIHKQNIQKIASILIRDYSLNKKSIMTTQYLNKFYYIYNKVNHYYDYLNDNNNYIYEISIINLYVINKINKPQGLFFFVKYLFESS